MKPNSKNKTNAKTYMVLCSLALILVLGLRDRYVGSLDTSFYCQFFGLAKDRSLHLYLEQVGVLDGNPVLSEAGFFVYVWSLAQILPEAQWFLLITSAVIITLTAKFIWNNSENYSVSWIVFICLGSMTFAMNGMRQALAMSICLLAYEYAKQKRCFPFLLVILIAVLFHKSAMLFIIVYFISNMKMNSKSILLLGVGVILFLTSSDKLAFLYDTMTGEDYFSAKSFEGGGIITVLIYLIAIALAVLCYKQLREKERFISLAMVILGLVIYVGRYFSTQMYERVSYYFFYFLMVLFPITFNCFRTKDRQFLTVCFTFCAFFLYAYRINKGSFANFRLFW